ncbi:MAG: putative lipoprotein, partial [Myxococcales bacterium]|nr:putative lipoprotein [Myxococcales bacterium]
AGAPTGTPKSVVVTTQDFAVDGKGTVFNVADDYFNDGLVPATPVANFGIHSQIIPAANDDGSLDVAWLDYAAGAGAPWAVKSASAINVTHVDAALATATTAATGLRSYKLLGFARDPSGAFYVAYNKDHALKSTVSGNANNINGNELHVAKLTGGASTWDTLVFGDKDQSVDATLGDPGGAASGVVGFDAVNMKVALYLGHSMLWTPTRHQAGFFRLLDPASGAITAPAGNDIIHFGAGWWYSHNFNQRMIIDGGNYYVLGHGDAYPRQLGFARWSLKNYVGKNDTDFNEAYWAITGNEGDNNTNAQTGQFVRLGDGRFLMVHTTSQGRGARDVRLVIADGTTGKADAASATWLTTNQSPVNATMPKVGLLGDDVLVTYALWDSSKKHQLTWYAAVLDTSLKTVVPPTAMTGVEFVDSAPLFRFQAGANAGKLGWVSGNAAHTLSVHVASLGR